MALLLEMVIEANKYQLRNILKGEQDGKEN
jgi:hypothetical protein